jgi:hypothetical protein
MFKFSVQVINEGDAWTSVYVGELPDYEHARFDALSQYEWTKSRPAQYGNPIAVRCRVHGEVLREESLWTK